MRTDLFAQELKIAKILLVDHHAASRLTLQAVLRAGGYFVDVACSADEALEKMNEGQYALILSDLPNKSPECGLEVLAHARLMEYKPAIAILTSDGPRYGVDAAYPTLIEPQNVPDILGKVADLISKRAAKLVENRQTRKRRLVSPPQLQIDPAHL